MRLADLLARNARRSGQLAMPRQRGASLQALALFWDACSNRPSTKSSPSLGRRSLHCESLESRRLLTGIGLQGQYFDSADLSGTPALVRTDAVVDFDWAAGSPDPAVNSNQFSVRWAGQVEANVTESHSFHVNADDGARLWVNGQLLIDQFDTDGVDDATASIDLIAGRRYDVLLEFREATGDAAVRLEWSSPSIAREVIPTAQLFAAERGGVSSTRFDGLLHAPQTGEYTFFIAADDRAELWLSNTADRAQGVKIAEVTSAVSDQDFTAHAEQQSTTIHLVAGQTYAIEAFRVDDTAGDHPAVAWQRPGSETIEVIPGSDLSPLLPTVKAYAQEPIVSEDSGSPARLTVVRTGTPLSEPLTVSYDVSGSATNGTDYLALPGSITIPAGQASTTIDITPIVDEFNDEGSETIQLTLRDGVGYDVGLKSERTVLVTVQDNREAPAGGQTLWDGTTLADFQRFGASFSTVNVSGVGDVIQAQIGSAPSSQFSVQLRQTIDSAVAEGDLLLMDFRVRSIGGPGKLSAIFEHATTFDKSLFQGIDVGSDWQRVQLPFTSNDDYAVGEALGGFHLGFQAQTLQFADLQLLNYGPPRLLAPETAFNLNNLGGTWGSAQTVSVSGQPFDEAYQVTTETTPPASWRLQVTQRNEGLVNTADTMRFSFYIRAIAGADPRAALAVQRTDGFSDLFRQQIPVTNDWVFHSIDVDSDADYDANDLQTSFSLGYDSQTVQIGGFRWDNASNPVDLDDLPRQVPAISYGGRGGDDDWRADADARIEAVRKSAVTINVVDNAFQAVEGAVVSLQQTRHDFRFGSAINAFDGKLDPNGTETALKYQSEIRRLFNAAVAENSHKWPNFISNEARALQLADFAESSDLFLRGHVVVWPSRNNMPSAVWAEYDSREAADGTASANQWLRTTVENHLDDIVDTFRGRITEWDVVNEPWTNHDLMDVLGDEIVVDLFQRFRDADPNVDLALNDFQIFASNGNNTSHRNNFDGWLQQLADADLLDVIGEQSHYSETNLTDIDILGQLIDSYHTNYSAPVAITEFDVNSKDLQLQADYLRDYMTMSFSQPGVSEFLHWGFWEDSHWLPDAALYRSDFSIKPNGQAYEDLVFGNWWTDTTGTTRGGSVDTQAFIGDYDVLVQYNGQTYNATMEVDGSGNSSITVVLTDIGSPALSLVVQDEQIAETDGAAATTATVTRTGDLTNALDVTLVSSDPGEATLPTTVTIPAGQSTSPAFAINAIDDGVSDAAQTVTFTASAVGLDSGQTQTVVTDVLSHRLSNLTVIVQDEDGNPLPDATIDVAMTQHAFQFGTQVQDRFLTITESEFNALATWQKHHLIGDWNQVLPTPVWQDAVNYRTAVYDNFNHIIPTNGMQWIQYRNTGPVHLDRTIQEAQARGITVTGHAVVWQNDGWPTPNEFRPDANPDAQEFHDALIDERLSSNGILARFSDPGDGPNVLDWDVLNEPLHETHYSNTFVDAGIYANANEAFVDYFVRADALRPDANLAVNDYNILSSGGDAAARQYRDLINDLLALGAPIDQIKVQAHMDRRISKADATRRLDILAETGLPIALSEFDMRDDANQISPANQKLLFEDILEASFEHPAVNGFSMWGIWDSAHWRGNGPLYDQDWNVKDEASPWFDLVQGDWKTELSGMQVDAAGQWVAPHGVFQGDYQITASSSLGSVTVQNVEVTSDGEVIVTIDSPDFGDAPASYGTLLADDGARHVATGPQLGTLRDTETDGVDSSVSDGDGDDEDGVLFGGIGVNDPMAALNVELSGATEAKVDAWVDFNRDGSWDASEKILDNVLINQSMQTLNYDLPESLSAGTTHARVRISTEGGLSPYGLAADGEVEDYLVHIIEPPSVESVEINGGEAQRSSLDSVRVTLDRVVDIDTLGDGPFQLTHVDSGDAITTIAAIDHSSGKTVIDLTFDSAGDHVTGTGSLENGEYRLTLDSSRMTHLGMALDGNGDGLSGGAFELDALDGLYRKFGDSDGNGSVALNDFGVFRGAFGRTDGEAGYYPWLDSDGNGIIGLADFGAFRATFGT